MNSDGVSLPLIHEHIMMPLNDLRKGDCCGRFETTGDGYYCERCDFFVHKKCGDESIKYIQHPSHPDHTLRLVSESDHSCDLCGRSIEDLFYSCEICDFDIDLYCVKYPPPKVIDIPEMHHHKITLLKEYDDFDCGAKCGNDGYRFQYKCHECDLAFHVDCIWHPSELNHHLLEVNHSYHSFYILLSSTPKVICRIILMEHVAFAQARLMIDLFYHCSLCNFTLDMRCVLRPPLQSLSNLKAHDHQLTLLPRLDSFTCNACGLKGDRSPYVCFQCGFMIHQDCLDLPRLININRHDHRVSRTPVLGVVNSLCGVCHKNVDWTYGGFSCQRCPSYVVHSKCATREDVWNGKELEGVPEETEDIEPYVVVDDKTIQHFSHKEHYLRLHINDVLSDDNKRCRACTHPICLQSFYSCMECDFILHQSCAEFLKMKRHFLHNDRLTLVKYEDDYFVCLACHRTCNGFRYQDGNTILDVRCASISEPFFHPSHPDHLLYYTSKDDDEKICTNGCIKPYISKLSCIEEDCGFILCFHCATLPQMVKHRVDDHPLSLCYGETVNDTYWCDICEKESDPKKWFYTSKDQRASLHTKCVLGDYSYLMPRSILGGYYEVVLNNSVSRPICSKCKAYCIYPIILKKLGTSVKYFCSNVCWYNA